VFLLNNYYFVFVLNEGVPGGAGGPMGSPGAIATIITIIIYNN
jgi:hypothetical protein